ncbi:histidine phosphatase family protein [Rhodopirellula sp. MGV]|uniref:histidine phosphatase family protein n=1 Tax=Rhodopirellula sp. MGV TaxID=2023130 RepID=UPI000B9648A4|nr:histidine phosphatase family protein [Rhodopirellula sp. MGV]OYP39118.1 hypothetical protein CGZ80_00265 [Rhodopirellula sp. MGV]PNY35504.1 histidine phosphatase family protein [Rhodopirellula baltica]
MMQLRNRFLLLRHGQSQANVEGQVASSLAIARHAFGLTATGQQEIEATFHQHKDELSKVTAIFCSPFLRTMQSAKIIGNALGIDPVETTQLRERYFGDFDGTSSTNYEVVWQQDKLDPSHCQWDVESVLVVAERMWDCVESIDQTSQDLTYLLVSHGDPIQILLTRFKDKPLTAHRSIKHVETAQLICLNEY